VSSNPVYSFFATPGSLAPFFLRMALAAVFFYHGMQKAFGWFGGDGWNGTIEAWTSAESLGMPYLIVAVMIVSELGIALSLFLGFLTRLGGLGVVVIMLGALFYIHGGSSFEAIEYPVLLLASGLALVFIGGGNFSIDRGISSNLLPVVG